MKYIGIFNNTYNEFAYAEMWANSTAGELAWMRKMIDRLDLTTAIFRPEQWLLYTSDSPANWLNADTPIP